MIILPDKVYKYMSLKWLHNLETTNEIFINHLNNYPEDKYGTEIGDNLEGNTSIELKINQFLYRKT